MRGRALYYERGGYPVHSPQTFSERFDFDFGFDFDFPIGSMLSRLYASARVGLRQVRGTGLGMAAKAGQDTHSRPSAYVLLSHSHR